MNFFKIISVLIVVILFSQKVFSEEGDQKKNIVEKAKDINQQIKDKQAITEANISSEIGEREEEPLPLNDPFAGDSPSDATIVSTSGEQLTEMQSLKQYKLVGIFEGKNNKYITLVNSSAEYVSLELFEEINENLK